MGQRHRPDWVALLAGEDSAVLDIFGSGSSRDTILLDAPALGGRAVARHARIGGPLSDSAFTLAREAATFRAVRDRVPEVPVPEVLTVTTDGTAFATRQAAGDPAERGEALDTYLECLGRLHAAGPEAAPSAHRAFDRAGGDDLRCWKELWQNRVHRDAPLVALAFQILEVSGAFAPEEVVLCHGDAGPGNYLHDGERVTALLDWELAHTGDPHDDLASIAVRAALSGAQLGEFRTRIERHYEPETGHHLDQRRFDRAVVAVLTRMVISCLCTLDNPASGSDRTVQLLGLPLMEVQLVHAIARLDRSDPGEATPVHADLRYAAELAAGAADVVSAFAKRPSPTDQQPCDTGTMAPAALRRASYALSQLAGSLSNANVPGRQLAMPEAGDTLQLLHHQARARLATLPASTPIAYKTIPGAA